MKGLLNRSCIWWLTTVGGSALLLTGCDTTARDTLLSGAQNATGTLLTAVLSAIFENLKSQGTDTTTSVRAVIEQLPQFFA
jgi:hypothetical protein